MTLPTERFPKNPESVGIGDGDGTLGRGVAVLDSRVYRDMRWCMKCEALEEFVECYECDEGRVGVCLGCGDERIALFTRVNSEVA